MFESLLFRVVFILLLTTTIVISQDTNEEQLHEEETLKQNITCLCTEDEQCDGNSRTCQLFRPHHTCYESWTLEASDNSVRVTAGCMYNDFFFVKLMCGVNQTNRYIVCCSQRDYCNDLDGYSKEIRTALESSLAPSPSHRSDSFSMLILIIIISTVVAILLLAGGLFIYIKQKNYKKPKTKYDYDEHKKKSFLQRLLRLLPIQKRVPTPSQEIIPNDPSLTGLMDDFSSSTMGPALPLLMQRTLARQITLEQLIGAGRYGSVHRGKWREDYIAVKIFSANDERSWFREIDIYQTVCLRHENILGYIAADNMDASTHTQLWLVTEYHENGSVYDYLMNHTISVPILVKMMLSIASGLCHLHMPIDSTNGKVALAHRDLKTKNILVKKDLTCCIADLGLAVKEVRNSGKVPKNDEVVIDIQENNRVGTIRYMAPEILDGTLNRRSFESFKAADIYALGLCYWEMIRRCRLNPSENDADSYQVPYEDVTPNNPTFDQMKEVVCIQKLRPTASPRWLNQPVLHSLMKMCEELWNEDPSCRLSSLNIKKYLKQQLETIENDLSNINIESQQQSTQNNGPWTA